MVVAVILATLPDPEADPADAGNLLLCRCCPPAVGMTNTPVTLPLELHPDDFRLS